MRLRTRQALAVLITIPFALAACSDGDAPARTATRTASSHTSPPTLPMHVGERTHHVTDRGEEYSTIEHITVGGPCAQSSDVNGAISTPEPEGKKLLQVWATREVVSRKPNTTAIWHPEYIRPDGKPERAIPASCSPPTGYERWPTYVPEGESEQIYTAQWIPADADRILFGGDRVISIDDTEPYPKL